MNKLVITRWKERILTALVSEKRVLELGLEEEDSILGNIYMGKVKRIVKNLNSAFVDFAQGQTGYYSLEDNPSPGLKEGDEIVVQVARDAVKTKDPVLTSNLNFTGKYAVVTSGKKVIGFSSRITDKEFKERLRPRLEAVTAGEAGVIVRTNAYGMEEELLEETRCLMDQYRRIREKAAYRTCYSVLGRAEPEYLKTLKGVLSGSLEEVVTDDPDIYRNVKEYLDGQEPGAGEPVTVRLYEDRLVTLSRLYSLETVMDQALQKRVWLKSGGYLVIEITEAMVVIDVNTGKYSGKKNLADTIRMTNLEAAEEICCQLRLRNLSGIILVDFIDMHREEDKEALMDALRRYVRQDSVKTTVVDMTQLNLVEMTRKKQKRPLWEQVAAVKGK